MKKTKLLAILASPFLVSSSFAGLDAPVSAPWAPNTGNNTEQNLWQILGFAGTPAAANSALNNATTGQQIWDTGIGNQRTSLIVEYAGNKNINTFGVYDPIGLATVPIFPGLANGGATTVLTISGSTIAVAGGGTLQLSQGGTQFGFYFTGADGKYFSQFLNNVAQEDHLVTVNKDGKTYLGWEDLNFDKSDKDYQDMVLSISAVPEPTTMIAGAFLLLPFGISTLRIMRKKA